MNHSRTLINWRKGSVNMNVLQDVFRIFWHRNHGTCATINGLLLGLSMTINGYGHGHGHGHGQSR